MSHNLNSVDKICNVKLNSADTDCDCDWQIQLGNGIMTEKLRSGDRLWLTNSAKVRLANITLIIGLGLKTQLCWQTLDWKLNFSDRLTQLCWQYYNWQTQLSL